MTTGNKARAEQLRGREVRRLQVAGLECRADDASNELRVTGYASVTATPYDMGFYQETISRGAFTKTLSETPDVQLLVNHEGLPLARTTNGSLTLREDDKGLMFEATLDATDPDAQQIARKLASGLMDQASFAFRVTRQTWDDDYENRSIDEVSLDRGDVSIVNYGASPTTSVAMRALAQELGECDESVLAELRTDPSAASVVERLQAPPVEDETPPAPVSNLDTYRARAFVLRRHVTPAVF